MNLRLALYDWISGHGLDARASRRLFELAGLHAQPDGVARRFWPAMAVCGAALAGFGLLLWLAANWNELGRMGRFALLQAAVVATCLGAALVRPLRVPLGLLAFFCIGGLFAYFGQTYQTGADAWQLFALWAVLALPLALGARSDVLWAPWALVAAVAISTWTFAHTGHRWRVEPADLGTFAIAWTAAWLLVAALSPAGARFTGAGAWAMRTAATLAVLMVMLGGIGGLVHREVAPHYWLSLVLLAAAGASLARGRFFDIFVLSALALGLDVLLVGGIARFLFSGASGDPIGRLFLIGIAGAGLVAFSVATVLRMARRAQDASAGSPPPRLQEAAR